VTSFPLFGDASAACQGLVLEALASAQASGCTTSPVRSCSNEFAAFCQSFRMVCSGARNRIIDAIADLGRLAIGANE
jgi:hypothetical protein